MVAQWSTSNRVAIQPKSKKMSEQDVFDSLKYRVVVVGYGTRYYYNNTGELHRDDGPAIEYPNGDKLWCQNGQLHRIDGPAVERSNGAKEWYQNDQLHRIDGPPLNMLMGPSTGTLMTSGCQRMLSTKQ